MSQELAIRTERGAHLTPPSLKPALNSMLSLGKKNRVTDEFDGVEENLLWVPPLVTKAQYERVVQRYIPQHEEYLRPAEPKWVNQRVIAFLSHYFVPDIPPQAQLVALADWVRLLSPFPQWAIEAAVEEWLSRPGRQKPMPGDIIAGCRWRIGDHALNLKLLRKLAARNERELQAVQA